MVDYNTISPAGYGDNKTVYSDDWWNWIVNEAMKEAVAKEFEDTERHMSKQEDTIDHPNYYNSGSIEAIEVIDDWDLGFCLGNAVKYIARAGKKNPEKKIEDLNKAIWYIQHEIEKVSHE